MQGINSNGFSSAQDMVVVSDKSVGAKEDLDSKGTKLDDKNSTRVSAKSWDDILNILNAAKLRIN